MLGVVIAKSKIYILKIKQNKNQIINTNYQYILKLYKKNTLQTIKIVVGAFISRWYCQTTQISIW